MKRTPIVRSLLFVSALALIAGCDPLSAPSQDDCEHHDDAAQGTPEQYPLNAGGPLGSTVVSAPLMCEKRQGYIHVERAEGTRKVGEIAKPGVSTVGCVDLPVNAVQDPTVCPLIAPTAIYHHAVKLLQAQGILVNGVGKGPCAETHPTPIRSAIGVVRWQDAEQAVMLVAKILVDYDLQGGVGVAVRGIGCDSPDARNAG